MTIYYNVKTEPQYKAAVGMGRREFDSLFAHFEKLYIPKAKNPHTEHRAPIFQDKREALFFILHYLKAYPTLTNMGLYFGCSHAAASGYIDLLMPVLKAAFDAAGAEIRRSFGDESKFEEVFAGVKDIYMDVLEIATQRPSDPEEEAEVHSGKKNSPR